jgi:hypothetical protein
VHLSQRFLTDLNDLARPLLDVAISPGFLSDLATADEAACETAASVSASDVELGFLANHLQAWRLQTEKVLKRLLRHLPEDDPFRCPISLFATMDFGRLETAHTRALAWLLDPRNEHEFGSKLLEALLVRVGGRPLPTEVHRVEPEYPFDLPGAVDATGRIDVLVEGDWVGRNGRRSPWRLVVEAKIDASEGEEQLSRYDDWLASLADNREVIRVFLTPEGRLPESALEEWVPLKFQELAEIFRAASDELRNRAGFQFLRMYLAGVLRDVCRLAFPIRSQSDDPYSLLDYLTNVLDRS